MWLENEYDTLFTEFYVDFGAKESVIGRTHRPLGYYAAEALGIDRDAYWKLNHLFRTFEDRFQVYLSAWTSSASGAAQQALAEYWKQISALPGYREWLEDARTEDPDLLEVPSSFLSCYEDPELRTQLITEGTAEQARMKRWLASLERISEDLRQFQKNVDFMLREQFSDNTKRSPAAYAEGLRLFQMILDDAVDKAQEEAEERGEALTEMDLELMPVNPNTICFASDVRISLLPNPHDSKDAFVTRVCFPSWKDFIYMDLYRGMAAGNLPFICENCHHYFLVRGCYKTVFCERIAPGETKKTCRQVGGHVKERMKIDTDYARREYTRAYNRIKMRRYRGRMTEEEFAKEYDRLNELKDDMIDCAISAEDFVKQIQAQYPARKK